MISLGIDTSNYASSVTVLDYSNNKILYNKKIFLQVKDGTLGIRQQEAVFNHIKNLTDIFKLARGEFDFTALQAIGVSEKPTNQEKSYMPCFLVGTSIAQSISTVLNIPLYCISHQDGHINSALFFLNDEHYYNEKFIAVHASGGTTDIMLVENAVATKKLGSTNDLFAGQAIDRLGVKLGYSFPAGEALSSLALECNDTILPNVSVKGSLCNLSGLENQCNTMLNEGKGTSYVAKYCLVYIGYSILKMLENITKDYKSIPVVFSGGVMSSVIIKELITSKLPKAIFVEPLFSQDNAIGVAAYAARRCIYG